MEYTATINSTKNKKPVAYLKAKDPLPLSLHLSEQEMSL